MFLHLGGNLVCREVCKQPLSKVFNKTSTINNCDVRLAVSRTPPSGDDDDERRTASYGGTGVLQGHQSTKGYLHC